ncbi:MAG: DUF4440 domain-containing protein, partial [Bacteroidetes bacterium]|nr:DUF4440 domain-containing protein [Bacteroidota bacterium]
SVGACQPQGQGQGQQAAVDTTAVIAQFDSLRGAYEQAVAAGDFEKMGTMLTNGAVMVQPGDPEWDTMRAASKGPFPPGATIDITPKEVRVLSRNWAYDFGTATVEYTPEGEEEPRSLHDTYLLILRKTPDGWKAHREVARSFVPPSVASVE